MAGEPHLAFPFHDQAHMFRGHGISGHEAVLEAELHGGGVCSHHIVVSIAEQTGIPPAVAVPGGDGGLMEETVKGGPVVHAGGEELSAAGVAGLGAVCVLGAQHGEGGDDGILAVTGPVLIVHHGAAGSDAPVPAPGVDGIVLLLPAEQVCADCVAPADIDAVMGSPLGIVLVEHVEDAVLIHQPVGIVEPAAPAGEMIGGAQGFPVEIWVKRVLSCGSLAAYDPVKASFGDVLGVGEQDCQLLSLMLADIQEEVCPWLLFLPSWKRCKQGVDRPVVLV